MVYSIFLLIHIISFLAWMAAFIVSIVFYLKVKNAINTQNEKKLILKERKLTMMIGHTAILGILVSGSVMVSISSGPQWGWFPFSQYGWLAAKQIIFIIILILAFGVSTPIDGKLKRMLKKDEQELMNDQQRSQWHKAWNITLIVNLLMIVNAYLGIFKP